ncbi:MAG: hypothetical protein ACSNEK_06335 [Parachlamydiaceae bacterium]
MNTPPLGNNNVPRLCQTWGHDPSLKISVSGGTDAHFHPRLKSCDISQEDAVHHYSSLSQLYQNLIIGVNLELKISKVLQEDQQILSKIQEIHQKEATGLHQPVETGSKDHFSLQSDRSGLDQHLKVAEEEMAEMVATHGPALIEYLQNNTH